MRTSAHFNARASALHASQRARKPVFERPQTPGGAVIGDVDRAAPADGEANDSLLVRVRSGESGNERAVLDDESAKRLAWRFDEAMDDDAVEALA